MAMVKAQTLLRSLVFTTVLAGTVLLLVSAQCAAAGAAASTAELTPTLLEKRDRGTVELLGGMDPMDVVRMGERNRGRTDGLPLTAGGETQPVGRLAPATGVVGPAFPIEEVPVYGSAANDQRVPAIAFDGTNYLVVWEDTRSGWSDIYGARVSAAGEVLDPAGIFISGVADSDGAPAVAFDGTNYLVVWRDWRNSSSSFADIYGARVSVGGSVLDPDGIAICTAAYGQDCPAIAFDGTNYLVVWADNRSGMKWDIYGARVDTFGVVLDPSGIGIATAANDERYPAIAYLELKVVYLVLWEDYRSGTNWDIYGTRVDVDGTVLDAGGIAVSTAANDQQFPEIGCDGTYFCAVWSDYRSGTNWDIYGARLDSNGSVLDPAGIAVSTAIYGQQFPEIGFDGTNYLVAWTDYRSGSDWDIYGARVASSGVVLDPSGIAFSTAPNDQRVPAMAFDGTNYLVVWSDYRGGWNWNVGGTRVSAGGSVLDPTGIAISTAANNQFNPAIAFDGTCYFVVWTDWRSGSWDIYGARVTVDGVVIDTVAIPISTAPNNQLYPAVAFDGTNYLVVWQDRRGMAVYDIYGARVSTGGIVLDPAGIDISTAFTSRYAPAIAFDGTNYLVVWDDYRGGTDCDIYGARVSTAGVVLDLGGIAISVTAGNQRASAIAFDGTNYLVVWQDMRGGTYDIYGARVSTGGVVLDAGGIAISAAVKAEQAPAIAFDGTHYLVVWDDNRSGMSADIYGARVSVGGSVLDPSGIAVSTAPNHQFEPAIAFDGTNYLVVWEDRRSGTHYDIYAASVDTGGIILDPTGIPISVAEGEQYYPAVASGAPYGMLIAYQSFMLPPVYGAYRIWANAWQELVGVDEKQAPAVFNAHQSYPNPFNPMCTIKYELPSAGRVHLQVFDVSGSLVRTLVDGWREPGVYSEVWDGRADDGSALPSGVYFYSIKAGEFAAAHKMVLLK